MSADEAVDAAAKAILLEVRPNRPWDGWTPDGHEHWRSIARAALDAAAPHLK